MHRDPELIQSDDEERAPGDSREQRECEDLIIQLVSTTIGRPLMKRRIALPNGGHVEIDGCSEDGTVLCEAWAHQGGLRPAQKYKVVTDAAKLFLAGNVLNTKPRKLIAFADVAPAKWFRGRSWMSELLKTLGIELLVVDLPAEVRARICTAQQRQYR